MTIRDLLLARAEQDTPALLTRDQAWTWRELVADASARAAAVARRLDRERPPHVGLLMDNTPEMVLGLAAAGLGGHVAVGVNSTRRGDALVADLRRADVQLLLTDSAQRHLLDGLDLSGIEVIDTDAWQGELEPAPAPEAKPTDDSLFMLIFTSGTSGRPKAVRITHEKVTYPGQYLAERFGLTADDVHYVAMPLFHSNAVMAGWAPALVTGAPVALREKFSASEFLPDVRRFGATYTSYVGKPLTYVLATPERPDDADNTLRLAFGNEAGDRDVQAFAERFGCQVVDGFGSTENAVIVSRMPGTPPGALGWPADGVAVHDRETGEECPRAELDADGRVTNLDACVGELVNTAGAGQFAGYYNDEEATAERMRGGMYWSGDLAYRDADGWVFFAGRTSGWLRVDGENLASAPIERVLLRHPAVDQAAVYAVPDDRSGDQVAAALVLRGTFTPDELERFLDEQRDLSPKARPRYVRLVDDLPAPRRTRCSTASSPPPASRTSPGPARSAAPATSDGGKFRHCSPWPSRACEDFSVPPISWPGPRVRMRTCHVLGGNMFFSLRPLAVLAPLVTIALISPADADVDGLEQKLVAGSTAASGFGQGVAIDGDVAVVGSPGNDYRQGAVYVFKRSGDTWVKTAKLTASDGDSKDQLGGNVAIDGNTIVASATGDDRPGGFAQGAVYTFTRTGASQRTETAKLTASDAGDEDGLGRSVAIDGDTIVAGSSDDLSLLQSRDQGAVYTFSRTGSSRRTQTAKLTTSPRRAGDSLGTSVDIDGDTIVSGGDGAVYTFKRSGGNRSQTAKLTVTLDADESNDEVGTSVAIDGDTIVSGAYREDVGDNNYQGAAYTFTRTGPDRTETAKLTASDGAVFDNLGLSVDIDGDTIAVSAYRDSIGANRSQGSVYTFARTGGHRTETAKLTDPDGTADDYLGISVAMEGDVILAGASGDEPGGSALVFKTPSVLDPIDLCAGQEPTTGKLSTRPETFAPGQEVTLVGNFADRQAGAVVTFYRRTDAGQTVVGRDQANRYGNAYLNDYRVDGEQDVFARVGVECTGTKTLTPGALPQTGSFSASPATFTSGQAIKTSANFPSDQRAKMVTYYRKTDTGQEVIGRDEANSYGNAFLVGHRIDGEQRLYATTSTATTEVDTLTPTD